MPTTHPTKESAQAWAEVLRREKNGCPDRILLLLTAFNGVSHLGDDQRRHVTEHRCLDCEKDMLSSMTLRHSCFISQFSQMPEASTLGALARQHIASCESCT